MMVRLESEDRNVKKAILFALMGLLVTASAVAQKPMVLKYHTHESYDKVYVEALQAVSMTKFVVRQENKEQGTITARLGDLFNFEYATALVIVGKEDNGVFVRAIFTKHTGDIGRGPNKWRREFGGALKAALPDLTEDSAD